MNIVNTPPTPPSFLAQVEAEAFEELQKEKATAAKSKIKDSLKRIQNAEKVLQNLKDEHALLLRDIGA
jgi:hypothetical protein